MNTLSSIVIRRHARSVAGCLSTLAVSTVILAVLTTATSCGGGSPQQTPPPPSNAVAFSPSSGSVGTVVTITGTDFSNTQSASIGNVPAVIVSKSSSSLAAIVMPGAASGAVSVVTSGGTFGGNGTFTVTPTGVPKTQQGSKLTGSGNVGESQQGYSVALSADGNTAALGGVADNSSAGAVWIFVRSGTTWSQQGNKLVGSGAVASAVQGYSLALSADGNTLLVGAPYDDSHVGAAWIFTRSGSNWTQQGDKLIGTGAVGNAWQGWAVALSADGNTALVSGPADGPDVGAVWFYTRSGSAWTQQGDKLVGTGSFFSQHQGTAVALSSDGSTALVGAPSADSNVGGTWVFTRSGTSWTQQGEKLVGTGAVGEAFQGTAAAISADGNTALIGGASDDSGSGAAWIFTRSGTSWMQQGTKLVGTGAPAFANQGLSAALSADGNTAIVGSKSDATWVFTRSGSVWTQSGPLLVSTDAVGIAIQGFSVAISADGNTALTGGPNDDSFVGAAWVYTPQT